MSRILRQSMTVLCIAIYVFNTQSSEPNRFEDEMGPEPQQVIFHLGLLSTRGSIRQGKREYGDLVPHNEKQRRWWAEIVKRSRPSSEAEAKMAIWPQPHRLENNAIRWIFNQKQLEKFGITSCINLSVANSYVLIHDGDTGDMVVLNPSKKDFRRVISKTDAQPACFRGPLAALYNHHQTRIVNLISGSVLRTISTNGCPVSMNDSGSVILFRSIEGAMQKKTDRHTVWDFRESAGRPNEQVLFESTQKMLVSSCILSSDGDTSHALFEDVATRTAAEQGLVRYVQYNQGRETGRNDDPTRMVQDFARTGGSPLATTYLYPESIPSEESQNSRKRSSRACETVYLWRRLSKECVTEPIDTIPAECTATTIEVSPCADWLAVHLCCMKDMTDAKKMGTKARTFALHVYNLTAVH